MRRGLPRAIELHPSAGVSAVRPACGAARVEPVRRRRGGAALGHRQGHARQGAGRQLAAVAAVIGRTIDRPGIFRSCTGRTTIERRNSSATRARSWRPMRRGGNAIACAGKAAVRSSLVPSPASGTRIVSRSGERSNGSISCGLAIRLTKSGAGAAAVHGVDQRCDELPPAQRRCPADAVDEADLRVRVGRSRPAPLEPVVELLGQALHEVAHVVTTLERGLRELGLAEKDRQAQPRG